MNREYYKGYSVLLKRDMELLMFGHTGRPVLFFPTRTARFYDYENWGIVEALKERIEHGELQLFCVDSLDQESFYNIHIPPAERIKKHLLYERYILEEIIPFIKKKNNNLDLEVAGCSMGAFHAANIAFRHPQYFKKVVSMSGRYDLTKQVQSFRDLFDGFRNEDIYFNMPQYFLPNLKNEKILQAIRKMDIIIAIGEKDPFISSNRELSDILNRKKIPHHLYIWSGYAHRPYYWQQMVKLYL